jgi:hypothetical protein
MLWIPLECLPKRLKLAKPFLIVENEVDSAWKPRFYVLFKVEVFIGRDIIDIEFSHPFEASDASSCLVEIINPTHCLEDENLFWAWARRIVLELQEFSIKNALQGGELRD